MEIKLREIIEEAPSIRSLIFNKPAGFNWAPGDYVELAIERDGWGDKRWLSIASAPAEDELRFTVRFPQPRSQFKEHLSTWQPGDSAWISPPIGNFNLPRRPEPILFVAAGGVGITPIRAMLSGLAGEWDIKLLYLARPSEHLFRELLDASPAEVTYIDNLGQDFGLDELTAATTDWRERLTFFSGARNVAEGLYEAAVAAGQPRAKLKLDHFEDYREI